LAVIYKACGDSGGMCCAMFSATMAPDVEQWCKLNLDNPVKEVQL
jgi:superfamily II DNA/RNA helicase